ncbi:disease resistance protein RPS2-like isoform X2 [Cicer arietinum]|nr:disease resistance protein RPS2-like isoform X2 [Cicer arietinum]XP_004498669.1 disease resistance protein RPS2-like isoform X2 [Cicer arietinum]XP_004498670.1 disease resistance protein RPS2-like isoform X2 [Cicer arietinum]
MDTIASVASSVALPVLRQFTYILMYNSYLHDLENEIQKLQREEKEMRHTVEAAKRNGEEIEDTVRDWFSRVQTAIEEAQAFLREEDQERVGCVDAVYSRYTRSQKARSLVDLLIEIKKETFDRISYRCALKCNFSSGARGYVDLESRTTMLNEILRVLKEDSDVHMIGVYGMAGIGKTALVKELAWQAEKDGLFDVVVLATVTNSPNVTKIRAEIADGLGLKFDELTEVGRASRLRQRIRQEIKILVILDDVWGELSLNEVGVPFSDDRGGCKVLVASRDRNVLTTNLGAKKVYRLEVLSEDESWSLFENRGGNAVEDVSIKPVAMKVSKNCAGLPLLIVNVVEALKNKDLYAWKDALEQIENFDFDGCFYSQVHSSIEKSYDHLESQELKTFFLLLGSMGNSYNAKDLLVFGWCLGLHKHVDTLTDGRNGLHKLIDDLRDACLLLEGGRDSVAALKVVRIVAASIASKLKPFFTVERNTQLKEWPRTDFLKTCHHIFLDRCRIHELPERLECPNLKILKLNSQDNNNLKVHDNFFDHMKELKILSLGNLNFTPSLPSSISLLTNLQALNLNKCMLQDISIVGEIKSLEILNLEKSELKEIPAEIGRLTNLRLLDLTDCSTLEIVPRNLISSLTSLEELNIGNCNNIQWEVMATGIENQKNNSSLSELRNLHQLSTLNMQINDTSVFPRDLFSFGRLESYKILIGDGWKFSEEEDSENYKSSTRVLKLNLSMDPSMLLDYGIKMLTARAEDLYLAELKGVKEVLYELNDEGFSHLKHLSIKKCDEMESIIGSTNWSLHDNVFINLESLILHNMMKLERICSDPIPTEAFAKLQVIKVKNCDRMEFVLLNSMVKHLSELVEIEISECGFMKYIIDKQRQEDDGESDKIALPKMRSLTLESLPSLVSLSPESCIKDNENNNDFSSQLLNDKVEFPNLENLKLCSINVQRIWDDKLSADSCFKNLTKLTVDGCEKLAYLFSYSVAERLVKLEHLLINSCKLVEKIFVPHEILSNFAHIIKSPPLEMVPIFPNLETLVISQMDNLKSIWPNQLPQNSFGKLKKLEITSCDQLLNVFPSHVQNKLQSIESLNLLHCPALQVIYEIDDIREEELKIPLRTLSLGHLPNLKYLWNKDPQGNIKFHNLFVVKAEKCESLKHLFPFSVAKDLLQLQVLEISDCGVEEIIAKDHQGEVEECVGLVFPRLVSLKFLNLKELKCFCSGNHNFRFPYLNKLYVVECPIMETFSHGILRASILRKICVSEKGDLLYWEGDLNTTIRNLFRRGMDLLL